jgi:hypothetical protein
MQPYVGETARRGYHSVEMNWRIAPLLGICFVLLSYGTVLVFLAFDRDSHSASDTIRPFVITMAPVWIVAIAAARVVLKRS